MQASLERDTGKSIDEWVAIAKTCPDPTIKGNFLKLSAQAEAGLRLSHCDFSPAFPAIFAGMIAAHDELGSVPLAFKQLAELLEMQSR